MTMTALDPRAAPRRTAGPAAPVPDAPSGRTPRAAGAVAPAALRAELLAEARAIDHRFQMAGTTLSAVLATLETVSGQLGADLSQTDGTELADAGRALRAVAADIAALPERRRRREALIGEAAEVVRHMDRSVGELRRIFQVLEICGVNVKIAARGAEDLIDLLRRMSGRLTAGSESVDAVARRLGRLRAGLDDLADMNAVLDNACRGVVPEHADRLIQDADRVGAHRAALARRAAAIAGHAGAMRGLVARGLTALQVGDITRQRLEHVAAAVAMAEDAQAAWADHPQAQAMSRAARGLVAAQIGDAARGFGAGLAALDAVFADLAPHARGIGGLADDDADEAGPSALHKLMRSVAGVRAVIGRVHEADRQAVDISRMIVALMEDLTPRVAALATVRLDVQQMAINLSLHSRQATGDAAAVKVVAGEIQSHSRRLDEEAGRILSGMDRLRTISAGLAQGLHEGQADGDGILRRAAQGIGDVAEAGRRAVAVAAASVGEALAALRGTQAALRQDAVQHCRLDELGARLAHLAGPMPDSLPDAFHLGFGQPLHDRYTMREERDLHDRLVPRGDRGAPPVVAAADPFDDILF